jgi:hypothetical protein
MGNKAPVQTQQFKEYSIKPIGINEKLGNKVYGVRLPIAIQEKLDKMTQEERVILMRTAIIKAVNEVEQT